MITYTEISNINNIKNNLNNIKHLGYKKGKIFGLLISKNKKIDIEIIYEIII